MFFFGVSTLEFVQVYTYFNGYQLGFFVAYTRRSSRRSWLLRQLLAAEMAAATTPLAPLSGRCKRRKEISAQEIAILPIEEFTQEQSTKGSYSCYIQPYGQFAIDNCWTSSLYPEAMQCSVLTQEYIQTNEIKPMCSTVNVEAYLKVFHQNGRRRVGVVSGSMARV
jgi:hypothetical protein